MQKTARKTPNIREMRQVWKSAILQRLYSPCKGYSLCKMVSLGQKLGMPKTCEKPFYKNIGVVLCKKLLEKTPNIREMRQVWKSAIFAKWSVWVKKLKCQKDAKNHSTRILELFCAKNHWKKNPNIREMRQVWKSAILQRL